MSSPLFYSQDGNARFKKRKARFSFSEVHIMLDEVKKHRHILVGNYERGAGAARRKRTWAKITARVNEIGECQREVIEIVKKWSDLKCDTKRKLSAMRTGIISHRGLSSRSSRDLNPTERIVFEILQMDNPGETSGGDYSPLGEDADGLEEEDLMEEEDLVAFGSPLNGEMTSMPPPPSTYSLSTQAFRFPQDDPLVANYSGSPYPEVPSLDDRQSDRHSDTLQLPPAATAQPSLTRPSPFSAILPEADGPLQDAMLQSATLSLREQHATNLMLETVSRSLELLSESVQQLAESQREFVRESLRLQCETVQVLRDFAGGAVALMHDKLNGRPAL